MDRVIIFTAEYLGWVAGSFVIVFILWPRKHTNILENVRISAGAVLAALIARFSFTEIIRYFYNSPRPFEIMDGARQLIEHSPGLSFPSGHAAFFFALATGVFFYRKWWGVLFYALALAISVGRVAAGLHWPSDILGGAMVGIFSALLVDFIFKKFKKPA